MASQSKVAIVTGASRGIGHAIALHLAQKGFDLVVSARTVKEGQTPGALPPLPGSLESTAAAVQALGRRALAVKLDALQKSDIENVVQQAVKAFGRIDVLVNNAAKFGREGSGRLLDTPMEEYENEVQVNVLAPLYFIKLVVPVMVQQGGGIVLNISSEAAHWDGNRADGTGIALGYNMTKAALNRQASTLAKEFKQDNVAVINVVPGFVAASQVREDVRQFALHVDVPASVCAFLATHPNPMFFSGREIDCPTFAVEHNLVNPQTLPDLHGPVSWGLPPRSPRPLNPWS